MPAANSAPQSSQGSGSTPTAAPTCPTAWAADWQEWADTIGAVVYCPTFIPSPFTGEIGGQWLTAKEPGRSWQLGYSWLEHGDLVHVVFEGYPASRPFPPTCAGVPCFDNSTGTEDIGGKQVTWYERNEASHSGHLAAVFRANAYIYVVSMHISQPNDTEAKVRDALTQTLTGLVPVEPTQ
ncbi:MAG: hypothetical protein QOJ13_2731 [Gaiellales bacterium]|jgi:hypothetical protein|nr:hypothetical protein [Gaiellales bacterium]